MAVSFLLLQGVEGGEEEVKRKVRYFLVVTAYGGNSECSYFAVSSRELS